MVYPLFQRMADPYPFIHLVTSSAMERGTKSHGKKKPRRQSTNQIRKRKIQWICSRNVSQRSKSCRSHLEIQWKSFLVISTVTWRKLSSHLRREMPIKFLAIRKENQRSIRNKLHRHWRMVTIPVVSVFSRPPQARTYAPLA